MTDPTVTSDVPSGVGFAPACRAWTMPERGTPGHICEPRSATAEKGEPLFGSFPADVVKLLNRVVAWDGKAWDA